MEEPTTAQEEVTAKRSELIEKSTPHNSVDSVPEPAVVESTAPEPKPRDSVHSKPAPLRFAAIIPPNGFDLVAERVAGNVLKVATVESLESSSSPVSTPTDHHSDITVFQMEKVPDAEPEAEPEAVPVIVVTESGPQVTSEDEEEVGEVRDVKETTKEEIKKDEDSVSKPKVMQEPVPEPKSSQEIVAQKLEEDLVEPHESSDPFAEDLVKVAETKLDEPKVEEPKDLAHDQIDGPTEVTQSPSPSPMPRILAAERKKAKVAAAAAQKVTSEAKPKPTTPPKPKVYPTDLNPFGEEDEVDDEPDPGLEDTKSVSSTVTSSSSSGTASTQTQPKVYPTVLNPFGDDDEETEAADASAAKNGDTSAASLNPFGDCDGEEEVVTVKSSSSNYIIPPMPSPRKTMATSPVPPPPPRSPRGVRGTPVKKRQAPAPPTPTGPKPGASSTTGQSTPAPVPVSTPASPSPSPAKSTHSLTDPSCESTLSSASSSVASSRTPTPVPRRSKQPGTTETSSIGSTETAAPPPIPPEPPKTPQLKLKKRPAPPIPAFKRSVKSSVPEMDAELNRIGDELPVVEATRLELEKWLLEEQKRQKEVNPEEEPSGQEYEDKLQQYIEFSIKRCKMAQKQKEYAFSKREHKLGEAHVEIEFQLRKIMSKQEAQKTEEDKATEADLLARMVEIIDERNDIIEAMVKAENLEIEEYIRMIAKVIPEQAKELMPKPLHEVAAPPLMHQVVVKSPEPKVHKHKSASKLLKQTTASTLHLLKIKKKKKKKDKEKGGKDVTDGAPIHAQIVPGSLRTVASGTPHFGSATASSPTVPAPPAESSDTEPDEDASIATSTADDSLRTSIASIDMIAADSENITSIHPDPKDRSESRASLPAEPVTAKDTPEIVKKKKKGTFSSLSKSTFKKLSPKMKAADLKAKLAMGKGSSSPDVTMTTASPLAEPNGTELKRAELKEAEPKKVPVSANEAKPQDTEAENLEPKMEEAVSTNEPTKPKDSVLNDSEPKEEAELKAEVSVSTNGTKPKEEPESKNSEPEDLKPKEAISKDSEPKEAKPKEAEPQNSEPKEVSPVSANGTEKPKTEEEEKEEKPAIEVAK